MAVGQETGRSLTLAEAEDACNAVLQREAPLMTALPFLTIQPTRDAEKTLRFAEAYGAPVSRLRGLDLLTALCGPKNIFVVEFEKSPELKKAQGQVIDPPALPEPEKKS